MGEKEVAEGPEGAAGEEEEVGDWEVVRGDVWGWDVVGSHLEEEF